MFVSKGSRFNSSMFYLYLVYHKILYVLVSQNDTQKWLGIWRVGWCATFPQKWAGNMFYCNCVAWGTTMMYSSWRERVITKHIWLTQQHFISKAYISNLHCIRCTACPLVSLCTHAVSCLCGFIRSLLIMLWYACPDYMCISMYMLRLYIYIYGSCPFNSPWTSGSLHATWTFA